MFDRPLKWLMCEVISFQWMCCFVFYHWMNSFVFLWQNVFSEKQLFFLVYFFLLLTVRSLDKAESTGPLLVLSSLQYIRSDQIRAGERHAAFRVRLHLLLIKGLLSHRGACCVTYPCVCVCVCTAGCSVLWCVPTSGAFLQALTIWGTSQRFFKWLVSVCTLEVIEFLETFMLSLKTQ